MWRTWWLTSYQDVWSPHLESVVQGWTEITSDISGTDEVKAHIFCLSYSRIITCKADGSPSPLQPDHYSAEISISIVRISMHPKLLDILHEFKFIYTMVRKTAPDFDINTAMSLHIILSAVWLDFLSWLCPHKLSTIMKLNWTKNNMSLYSIPFQNLCTHTQYTFKIFVNRFVCIIPVDLWSNPCRDVLLISLDFADNYAVNFLTIYQTVEDGILRLMTNSMAFLVQTTCSLHPLHFSLPFIAYSCF